MQFSVHWIHSPLCKGGEGGFACGSHPEIPPSPLYERGVKMRTEWARKGGGTPVRAWAQDDQDISDSRAGRGRQRA